MFLPQSNQLYIETLTQKVENGRLYSEIQIFCKGLSTDSRRLVQFSLFKIGHLDDLDALIGHLSNIVASAAKQVSQDCTKELALFGRKAKDLSTLTFKRMTYADAVEQLKTEGFPELVWGDDLEASHEGRLTELMGPMFVTHYPADTKFFNMRNNDEAHRVVNSTDLLLPLSGESAGATEREFDGAKSRHKLETNSMLVGLIRQGMMLEGFEWYPSFHEQNEVAPHSGAGVGMAYVAQFILGQTDIRDCVPILIDRNNVIQFTGCWLSVISDCSGARRTKADN